MIRVIDTDREWQELVAERKRRDGLVRAIKKRRTKYGSATSLRRGLIPVDDALGAVPDGLIPRDSFKEVIERCQRDGIFPIHWQYNTWAPKDKFAYDQDGLGYCWTWSGVGTVMDCRAAERKPTVLLAPVSMGYLVGWSNSGNYLESFIQGAREDGICPAVGGDVNSTNRSSRYWAQFSDQRTLYRLDQVWDTNPSAGDDVMIQHCLSILARGRSLHIAFDWWSHALTLVGMRYDPAVYKGIVWQIRNSHGETDVIELTGTKGVPDEAYGFISTVLAA